MPSAPITNVSDTARWVAVYRAMETERPDAIFRDPFARKLAGERGEEIVRSMRRARSAAWAMIVRTAVMDEIITSTLATGGIDMIINLAAGLDARPWRMPLPPSLHWVDVDLPEILDYKTSHITEKPKCQYEAVHADLTDTEVRRKLFARLASECNRALVVSEGLLIYLTPEDVGALATDLQAAGKFQWWLIDLGSPRLLKMMRRSWGKSAQNANAPFLFAPAKGTEFFRKFGWREKSFRASLAEARRLKREMPGAGFWRMVGRLFPAKTRREFERMSAVVLLERA